MPDGLTQVLYRAQVFGRDLSRNNSKDWFAPRKDRWKTDFDDPARLFTDLMAEKIRHIAGDGHTGKVFRIYRDVRFSTDRSPLKTRLAMTWHAGNTDDLAPAFYFVTDHGDTLVACRRPGFTGAALRRYRAMIVTRGCPWADVITLPGARIANIGPAPFKRVPKPYDQDHPDADLMRRKSLALSLPMTADWRDNGKRILAALTDRVGTLIPLRRFLADRL